MPGKPRPSLADRYLAASQDAHFYSRSALDQIRRGIVKARRFVFDEDAARRVAHIVMEVPDLLAREHLFARAPYETTWIEWPSWHYWMEFRERDRPLYEAQGVFGDAETADLASGYLIDHDRVNVIAGGMKADPNARPTLVPIQYRLRTEWPVQEQIRFAELCRTSRRGIDAFLWGSTANSLSEDDRRSLRTTCTAELVPLVPGQADRLENDRNGVSAIARGSVGELRTIIALLLVMNRPSLTRYVRDVPTSRGWIGNKPKPFLSHTTVTINMDPVPTLRLIGTPDGEGVARRRHEVRGHYCHDETAREYRRIAGCAHEWQATGDDWTPLPADRAIEAEHWKCAACGGKRWWRAEHQRGSGAAGFILHDPYEMVS